MAWNDKINTGVNTTAPISTVQQGLAKTQSQIFNNAATVGQGLARIGSMPTANTGSTIKNIASNVGGALGVTTNAIKTPAFTFDVGNSYAGAYNNFMSAADKAGITDMAQKQSLWQDWSKNNINFDDANGIASLKEGANGAVDATTETQMNSGGALQAGMQIAQAGLAIYNAIQADRAAEESKRQFDKQWNYAVTDFNNQATDNRRRRRSSTNIGSSLLGLSKEEAQQRQDYASQFDVKDLQR